MRRLLLDDAVVMDWGRDQMDNHSGQLMFIKSAYSNTPNTSIYMSAVMGKCRC